MKYASIIKLSYGKKSKTTSILLFQMFIKFLKLYIYEVLFSNVENSSFDKHPETANRQG